MQPMYPGIANSPVSELADAIDATATTIEVVDGSKLPDAPNLATIGTGEDAETILYEQKTGNILSDVTRGFQGTAKAWPAGTKVSRMFTEYDHASFRQNIQELNTTLSDHTGNPVIHPRVFQQDTPPDNPQDGDIWINTSDDVYQGTVFAQLQQEIAAHKAEIATSTQLGHVKVGQNLAIDPDGTLHAQASGGKKVARFVIGTSTAGWTENDVDYLCDGVDDQEEINAAIQALPASGGEIIILDGTYNIGARIDVNKNNVTIRGNGDATVLKRMWNSGFAEGVIVLNSASNCKIENLQIDGNRSTYTSSNNHGIYLVDSSDNTITGNICNNNHTGIYLIFSSNNIITGNTCNNNNNFGIYLTFSDNNIITGNTFNNNENASGIYLDNGSNNTVTGNTCDNNDTGITLSLSNNNTVTGNTCSNINFGIYLYSGLNNTIAGNTCNNNGTGIYLISSLNNTVAGNTCNNNNNGITLSFSDNHTITGNTCIRGTGQSSNYTSSQYTIHLQGSSNNYNLISSNNCMGKDVVIEGGTSNTSVNNKYN